MVMCLSVACSQARGTTNVWSIISVDAKLNLVFIASTPDHHIRAFDTETGEELWKGRLPEAGKATPMSYRLGATGRQYVVIAAGGHWGLPAAEGAYLVGFALPN
jgi:glucose dehydrogenase